MLQFLIVDFSFLSDLCKNITFHNEIGYLKSRFAYFFTRFTNWKKKYFNSTFLVKTCFIFTNIFIFKISDYHDEDEAKCLLHVYIDSCHNLQSPATKYKESSKPSPFVELNIGNNVESQKTYPELFTNDPVFEKGFTFTVINPYSDDLHIRVIDSGHKDTEIGSIKIRTSGTLT